VKNEISSADSGFKLPSNRLANATFLNSAEQELTMTLFAIPNQTTLHYRIVTPMFLGGESHQADAQQFRNASFKGALRFWWRALNWGKAFNDAGQEPPAALQALHQREGALFGLASDGKDSWQSQVRIRSELKGATFKQRGNPDVPLKSVGYLLGQGLIDSKKAVTRDYIEGGELTICLSFKLGMSDADIESVEQAAIALGLLSGLGSRSRKGLGSLALQKIERLGQPVREFTTIESIEAFIGSLDYSAPAEKAPFSAISQSTRIDVSATARNALYTLKSINDEQQLYRSFGKDFKVNGQAARRNFVADHDNVLAATKGEPLQKLPRRAVFGLPHNYFFSSTKGNNSINITTEDEGRRASPLLVHIHQLQNGDFVAIQTLLQGVFLPDGMKVEAKSNGKQTIPDTTVDYSVIILYLDGFANKKILKAQQHG